ncbi:uncharacterized protein ARMOST_01894 [Armillaria ostoyae]|uniref:GPI-anchored wall transfer protein 1 n=1 Tax=Armillaria ostoyae TaxID=47428 RepID=A0A284QQ76_ARMOS|nr:uncharacterized protein ARMOST_01894 [Armillaria ostoyae]
MPALLSILMLIPALGLSFFSRRESGTPLPSNENERATASTKAPLPFLTTYRAHMLLMTILAILAVDFPVFPRSLAKCESFGVSLMDLGVGAFVFSQGVVSAIPLVKSPAYLASPVLSKLVVTIRQQLGLSVFSLQEVVLFAPRVGILSANKEGIVSLMGPFSTSSSEPVLIAYGLRLFRRASPGPINRDHDFTRFAFVLPPVPAPI